MSDSTGISGSAHASPSCRSTASRASLLSLHGVDGALLADATLAKADLAELGVGIWLHGRKLFAAVPILSAPP